jgi:indolepyruvate ferredoxin oxidoreductase, beta subunit
VVATEVSEALKAVRYVKPEGDFVLYAHVWAPTAVMLGKAPYPKLDEVAAAARAALDDGSRFIAIPPDVLPLYEGAPVADNIFTLGVVLGRTRLGDLLPPAEVKDVVRGRWKRGVERNMLAFTAGLAFAQESGVRDQEPGVSGQLGNQLPVSSFRLPASSPQVHP